jgi:hypothetical protein
VFTVLITINQILMAGVAITGFSLLLYSLTFNLKVRVARSFAIILVCLVTIYTAESLASVAGTASMSEFWLRFQWVGIVYLPAAYLHFSDALLATTGKPSRGKRILVSRISYLISTLFLIALPLGLLVGPLSSINQPAAHLQPTWLTDVFMLYYTVNMLMSWYNFVRAFQRTATSSSRRRMGYLLAGSLAPTLGSFPFLLFTSGFAARHTLTFWSLSVMANLLVGGLVVVMAYSVAFFGAPQTDRAVKGRLLKWILRGPVTASLVLAITTITRRIGELYGQSYTAFVPIVMAASIVLLEYLISLTFPTIERWLLYGNDKEEIDLLRSLEDRLITRNDLHQFLEMILSALCDNLQVPGVYLASLNPEGLELVVKVGKTFFDRNEVSVELSRVLGENDQRVEMFDWGDDTLVPLIDQDEEGRLIIVGLLGITDGAHQEWEGDQLQRLNAITQRAMLALNDRRLQENVFKTIEALSSKVEYIQNMRAAWRYDQSSVLKSEIPLDAADYSQWVKDALTHYWGGPKLTENPLLKLQVVQSMSGQYDGSAPNALRALLKEAIERTRPDGERRFTAEWVLYNILEMKFLEGKKVREIALRLAMSEADLYRKQRVAIEAIARTILEMESQNGHSSELHKAP